MFRTNGVYLIRNIVTGQFYIGSTTAGIHRRWDQHKYKLRSGTHFNKHLQKGWNSYGEKSFSFEIVFITSNRKEMRQKERELVKAFSKNCYNITFPSIESGISIDGRISIRQAETVARWLRKTKNSKISAAACRWQTPEQVAEIILGEGSRGIAALADEIRERIGQA